MRSTQITSNIFVIDKSIENEIKDSFFGAQGIFHYKLKHNNPLNDNKNSSTDGNNDRDTEHHPMLMVL